MKRLIFVLRFILALLALTCISMSFWILVYDYNLLGLFGLIAGVVVLIDSSAGMRDILEEHYEE